jgi:hypothetical protein
MTDAMREQYRSSAGSDAVFGAKTSGGTSVSSQ